MISRYSITSGGGGGDSVINQASGGGIMDTLTSPIVLIGGAIAGYFAFMR